MQNGKEFELNGKKTFIAKSKKITTFLSNKKVVNHFLIWGTRPGDGLKASPFCWPWRRQERCNSGANWRKKGCGWACAASGGRRKGPWVSRALTRP